MEQCGFDAFLLRDGEDAQEALAAFDDFSEAYQASGRAAGAAVPPPRGELMLGSVLRAIADEFSPALVHYTSAFFALPTGNSTLQVLAGNQTETIDVTGTCTLTKRWL